MGVAGQILQHMFRSTEGRLGVDHPLFSSHVRHRPMSRSTFRCGSESA
jgi:hypothetical protein